MPTVIIFLEAANRLVHRICSRNRVGATRPGKELFVSYGLPSLTHNALGVPADETG